VQTTVEKYKNDTIIPILIDKKKKKNEKINNAPQFIKSETIIINLLLHCKKVAKARKHLIKNR